MNCFHIVGLIVILEVFHTALSKSARELTAPDAEGERSEPSCDELRKMWKREMQQKSEVPMTRFKASRYHEPFTYGWKAQARPRNAMKYAKPVYGRIVHSPDKFLYRNNIPDRYRSYDQVARMVGSPSYYTPTLTAPPKPTFFRLEYPVRRPMLPVRISHLGRFQELQNILRNERADEMPSSKLKDNTESNDSVSGSNTDPALSGYAAFPYQQSRAEEDEDTSVDSRERKLRGTSKNSFGGQNIFSENKEVDASSIDSNEDDDRTPSTSQSMPLQGDVANRWATGIYKR